jgi:hypothetical protein
LHDLIGVIEFRKDLQAAFVVRFADFRQADIARAAVEESRAEPFF